MAIPFDTWRPFRSDKDDTDVQTIIRADDDDAPTNWVTARTVVFPALPAGEYSLMEYFTWSLEDTDTAALFRAGINGVFSGDRVLKEPKDSDEKDGITWHDMYTHTGGDLTVDLQFLKSDAGSGAQPLIISSTLLEADKKGD